MFRRPRNGKVGADAPRYHPLVEDASGDLKAEIHPAEGGIEEDAALLRFHDLRDDFALVIYDSARMVGEEVGDYVAGIQEREELPGQCRPIPGAGIADMHHKADAGLVRGLLCQPHHLDPQRGHRWADGPELHSVYHRLVVIDDANGLVQVNILSPAKLRHDVEAGPDDVQHAVQSHLRLGRDEAWEAPEGVAASAARVHKSGNARPDPRQVGIDTGLIDALVDVAVEIDEARAHQLAPHVDNP